jgi:KaiC/GvpD/RAD55 family RecA-like ATPase
MLLHLSNLSEAERKFIKDYKEFVNTMFKTDTAAVQEQYLIDQTTEMAAKVGLRKRITEIAKTFDIKTASEIITDVQDIIIKTNTGRGQRVEIDVADVKNNLAITKYHGEIERLPTGIGALDHWLYGGVGRRELMCFVAPSGRGKSVLLINIMYNMILRGNNVLFISMEMGVVDILRRLYRRILLQDKDAARDADDAHMEIWLNKFFKASHSTGKVVYYPANTFSVEDMQAEIIKLEAKSDFVPDAIVIDHLDLMTSKMKHIRTREAHSFWRLVTDDLHTYSLTNNIPIITATQATRASTTKTVVGIVDVGESIGKVQSSDVIISINQTEEERERKRMRLSILKNRDYFTGKIIELFVDLDLMMVVDIYFAQSAGLLTSSMAV